MHSLLATVSLANSQMSNNISDFARSIQFSGRALIARLASFTRGGVLRPVRLCDIFTGGVRCLDQYGQMISQYEGYQLNSSPKLMAASVRYCVSRDDVLCSIGCSLGYSSRWLEAQQEPH
jgi:hypothetical protein